jgi:hypothetical protein
VGASIEVRVLGPFQVLVDGDDRTGHLSVAQRSVLALLAGARGPVAKSDVCNIVGLSSKSIDPLLSKLRGPLGTDRPLHRSRTPGPGSMSLDPDLVTTDIDAYLAAIDAGAAAHARGDDGQALRLLLDAEAYWRGAPFAGVELLETPGARTSVAVATEALRAANRRCRELACWCWIAGSRDGLDGVRLRAWAEELRDVEACWSAATRAALERSGAEVAAGVLARWRERASIDEDAATTGAYARVASLVHGSGGTRLSVPARTAEMMERAESAYLAVDWDESEQLYLEAADDARARGDVITEAEVCLVMATLMWDPSRFGGHLDQRLVGILGALPADARLLRARVLACLAGGLYSDGTATPNAVEYAREALELAVGLDDPLTEAEVILRARRGLVDIDPPEVQIERSRRVLALSRGSDYHRSLGVVASLIDLLHMCREAEARVETDAYRRIAERTGSDLHGYYASLLDAMWALYDGRYDDVERHTKAAEAHAHHTWDMSVVQVVGGLRLLSAWQRGATGEFRAMVPVLDAFSGVGTQLPVWELGVTMLLAALGETDEALARFTAVAASTGDFAGVPRGPGRIAVLTAGAYTCGALAERGVQPNASAVAGLRTALVEHSATGVLLGWPGVYLGPKQRLLDLLPDPPTAG